MFENPIETKALEAYHNDPPTREELDDLEGWNREETYYMEGGQIEMSANKSVDSATDVQYMGGAAEGGGRPEGGSLLSKIFCCCTSKSKSDNTSDYTQHKWSTMNESQKKERI